MEKNGQILCPANIGVLQYLRIKGIDIPAYCGGNGTCGKCVIKVISGNLQITPSDRERFTEQELQEGFRLACKAMPRQSVWIAYPNKTKMQIVTAGITQEKHIDETHRFGVGIDIGTTTIALALVDKDTGKIVYTDGIENHQKIFGADVVSRILSANQGHLEELKQIVREDIRTLFDRMKGHYPALFERKIRDAADRGITDVAIAGNTTMIHLLLGYSCEGLGAVPFSPVTLGGEELLLGDLLEWGKDKLRQFPIKVHILSGISTYVGADITAGILAYDLQNSDKISFFLDLGTNGEMAMIKNGKIFVASTAAGPALEGGNLSCGVGSVQGAISTVSIQGQEVKYGTIGNESPTGLCGTGVVELMAELLNAGIVDVTGKLEDDYFENGFPVAEHDGQKIVLTQQDIRELQLAKGAIRAGIETLLDLSHTTYEEIDTLYISGGFGTFLRPEYAGTIGLIPKQLIAKSVAVGNSSLAGTVWYLLAPDSREQLEKIVRISSEEFLGDSEKFQKLFVENMNF